MTTAEDINKFRHLDLFSGIGGFALAASWVWGEDHEIVSFCEIEKYPQKVLAKHWPDVPCHDDIKTLKGDSFGAIDLITGGFPCQPFSSINTRGKKGKEHAGYIWPEMLRVIGESRPSWVIGENVLRFKTMGLDHVQDDLENIGYESIPFIIPDCAAGSPQLRERIFIVAHLKGQRKPRALATSESEKASDEGKRRHQNRRSLWVDTASTNSRWRGEWPPYSGLCRVAPGLPSKLDKARIRGLGNAIVPQCVAPIMQSIKEISCHK